jgi:hypothetical protein
MAQGRDFQRRSPRWLNCLLCSSGLMGAGLFIWSAFCLDGDQIAPTAGVFPRLLGAAVLPVLLCATAICRAARRMLDL